jgi:glycerol-3-phosphate acyltransferase PlsY
MLLAILITSAYLLGSVPFGLLIGLARGVDVRRQGSGNIGATNVGRVLGRPWGFLCLALDLLKGFAPAVVAGRLLASPEPDAAGLTGWLMVGIASVLGHTFPIYLGFRGGKGVATTIGVALGIYPYYTIPMLVALAVYAGVRFLTGFVSAGSLALAAVFPIAFGVMVAVQDDLRMRAVWPLQVVAIALALLIFMRHRSNIARLTKRGELSAASGLVEKPAQVS